MEYKEDFELTRILKRFFEFQDNQRLPGYRTSSELRCCALRYNPPPHACRNCQRAPVRHTAFSGCLRPYRGQVKVNVTTGLLQSG